MALVATVGAVATQPRFLRTLSRIVAELSMGWMEGFYQRGWTLGGPSPPPPSDVRGGAFRHGGSAICRGRALSANVACTNPRCLAHLGDWPLDRLALAWASRVVHWMGSLLDWMVDERLSVP